MGERAEGPVGGARFAAEGRGGGAIAQPRALRNSWFVIRELAGANRLTFPLFRLLPGRRALVTPETEVLIGGYIRSGNTFAYHAFAQWNPDARVAHHVHLVEQVARAVRLGVPTAVLIRPALDAVTSLVIFEEGRLSDGVALRGYLRYHRAMADLAEGAVFCRFADVLDDPGSMVAALNERFGTGFRHERLDEAGKAELLATIARYHRNRQRNVTTFSVPSAAKEERKPEVRARLADHPLLAEAQSAYDRLAGLGP